jgi:hypothetical protein
MGSLGGGEVRVAERIGVGRGALFPSVGAVSAIDAAGGTQPPIR